MLVKAIVHADDATAEFEQSMNKDYAYGTAKGIQVYRNDPDARVAAEQSHNPQSRDVMFSKAPKIFSPGYAKPSR